MINEFVKNLSYIINMNQTYAIPFYFMITVIIFFIVINYNQKIYNKSYFLYIIINLPGTLLHELMHFIIGLISLARPTNFSIIPKRKDGYITFGYVGFNNIRWYNAFPTGMAPLLIIPFIPYLFNLYFTEIALMKGSINAYIYSGILGYIFYSLFLSIKPSKPDFQIAFSNFFGIVFYLILTFIFIKNNETLSLF
jgi:hypothetical protein